MMTVKEGRRLAVQSAAAPANKFVVEEGVLALGTTAKTADARDGLGKYNEKAGLYLSGQVILTNASINVGETKAKNGVNIGSNGKLIVDASVDDGQEGNLSTDVTGKITGEKGSTIHYVHVADKGVVRLNMKASRPLRSTTSSTRLSRLKTRTTSTRSRSPRVPNSPVRALNTLTALPLTAWPTTK